MLMNMNSQRALFNPAKSSPAQLSVKGRRRKHHVKGFGTGQFQVDNLVAPDKSLSFSEPQVLRSIVPG